MFRRIARSSFGRFTSLRPGRDSFRLLGPIFRIELLITIRRARYYLMRGGYAFVLLVLLWINYAAWFNRGVATLQGVSEFGVSFFYSFATLQLVIALVVTAAVTAGAIAEERDRRTIEYLFATDLSDSEIVLGKLVSRLLLIVVFLMTGLPILSLTLLFGGVDGTNLLQLFAATASTLLLAASVSICISVWARRPREAIMRAFTILAGLLILPIMFTFIAFLKPAVYGWIAPVTQHIIAANPFVFLTVMSGAAFPWPTTPRVGWPGVWELVRNQGCLALFLLVLAVWRVRRVILFGGVQASGGRAGSRWWRLWRPRLGDYPVVWKEMFAEQSLRGGLASRIAVVLLFLLIFGSVAWQFFRVLAGRYRPEHFEELVAVLTTIIALLFLVMLSARAATSITVEKERQSWETLISTPLGAWDIVVGKVIGSVYAVRWLVVLMVALWSLAIVVRLRSMESALLLLSCVALLAPFFGGMGLFFSLRSRSSTRAICLALLVSVLSGGGYLFFSESLKMVWRYAGLRDGSWDDHLFGVSVTYALAWSSSWHFRNSPDEFSVLAYLLTLSGYIAAGVVLFVVNVRSFDRKAGRPIARDVRNQESAIRDQALAVGSASFGGEHSCTTAPDPG